MRIRHDIIIEFTLRKLDQIEMFRNEFQRIRIMDNIHRYLIVSDEKELVVKHDERKAENEAETTENAEPADTSKAEDPAPAAEEQASSSDEA